MNDINEQLELPLDLSPPEIMLDLETMDTKATAAIISIGAVKFDAERGVYDKFHIHVDLQDNIDSGRTLSGSTIMWWVGQGEDARKQLASGVGVELWGALTQFSDWVCGPSGEEDWELDGPVDGDVLMWGNGAAFDNTILANAYQTTGFDAPWKFDNDRCYRTMKNLAPDVELKRIGTLHNAQDDAESQALHLLEIRKHLLMGG